MTPEEETEIREWANEYREAVDNQETAPVKEADWIVSLLSALDAERELVNRAVPMVEHSGVWGDEDAEQWLRDVRERGTG